MFSLTAALLWVASARAAEPAAAEPIAAELLPASTVFYLEIEHPKDLLALVLDHPLRQRLEQSPDYQKALDDPKFKEFRAVVAAVEQRSGVPWRKALEATTGGGLAVAFDADTQGLVVLARAEDPKAADAVRDALLGLAREDAVTKGNPDPVGTEQYRGLTAYKVGDALVGNLGSWVVFCSKPDLAQALADTFLDHPNLKQSKFLAADEEFLSAREGAKAGGTKSTAWAFVRLAPLRAHAGPNPLFDKNTKSEDGVFELIFGALIGPLRNAPYATASLALDKAHLKLSLSSPNDPKWVEAGRKFLFPPPGETGGGAVKPLRPKGTILSVSTYRDLAGWWAAAPDLLNEGAAAKMAQADSGLSNFLGGKTFGGDVLGAIQPQINLVVASQDFKAAGVPEPTIKLPAFAAMFRLKEKQAATAQLRKHLRLAFQSVVTLTNLDGAAKGRPMLSVTTEKRGNTDILSASYDAEMMEAPEPAAPRAEKGDKANPDERGVKPKPQQDLHFNFSPAVVISRDHLILCSTRQLAEELADLAEKEGPVEKAEKVPQNTLIEVSAAPLAAVLRANREQLVAKNVLEKGQARDAAEKEVELLTRLVDAVRGAKLSLTPTDKTMTLELEITTQSAK